MKWVAFALILLAAPLLAAWLRTNPRQAPWAWGALTFLPFVIGPWNLDAALFATPMWSGYAKGWEISLLDALAIGVIVGTRRPWPRIILLIPFLAYILTTLLAVAQARFPFLSFSYVVQLLRVLLVFLAVARVAEMERGERALLTGLIAGLTVQAGYAIVDKSQGALQTGGSLGHQNLLGFMSHMVLIPAFAMFLATRWPGRALWGVIMGVIVVGLTASRATIALAGVGLLLTLILSFAVRSTGRKVVVGFAGIVLVLASLPLAQATLEQRFAVQKSSFLAEDAEREAFKRAAKAMFADHPFGVGPNHYVFIANTEGYSAREGVNWSAGNRTATVHNAYLLTAAETGFLGLTALIVLLVFAIGTALATAFRYRKQPGAELLIGVACALIAVSLHSMVEWMFVVTSAQYLFGASLGIIAGLQSRFRATQKGAARRLSKLRGRAPNLAQAPSLG